MDIAEQVTIIAKLLYMQTMMKIGELETSLLKTPKQKKAYSVLDGKCTISEIAKKSGYSGTRALEALLPEWESKGLILSIGKE